MYRVKEIFYSVQGEGARSGRLCVFCRFSGCNLWSGREEDRSEAKCYFCDTDFVGTNGDEGGVFKNANELAERILFVWGGGSKMKVAEQPGVVPYVVFTGGEPLLQLDQRLLQTVKQHGFETAVETNGTISVFPEVDWITVSPKPNSQLVQQSGSELKLVYPHEVSPESVSHLDFEFFYLMPRWTEEVEQRLTYTDQTVRYCMEHPQWRVTLQMHKVVGVR